MESGFWHTNFFPKNFFPKSFWQHFWWAITSKASAVWNKASKASVTWDKTDKASAAWSDPNELITDGNFGSGAETSWYWGNEWNLIGNAAKYKSVTEGASTISQEAPGFIAGQTYRVSFTLSNSNWLGAGYLAFFIGTTKSSSYTTNGRKSEDMVANYATDNLMFKGYRSSGYAGDEVVIDNVSVKLVPVWTKKSKQSTAWS